MIISGDLKNIKLGVLGVNHQKAELKLQKA